MVTGSHTPTTPRESPLTTEPSLHSNGECGMNTITTGQKQAGVRKHGERPYVALAIGFGEPQRDGVSGQLGIPLAYEARGIPRVDLVTLLVPSHAQVPACCHGTEGDPTSMQSVAINHPASRADQAFVRTLADLVEGLLELDVAVGDIKEAQAVLACSGDLLTGRIRRNRPHCTAIRVRRELTHTHIHKRWYE